MEIPKEVIDYIEKKEAILAAYLFGSRVLGVTKAADWDFAFVVDESFDAIKSEWYKYELQGGLSNLLKTDAVDISILNHHKSLQLANSIISDGVCFLNRHPNLDALERKIFHEYLDHKSALKRNGFKV